MVGPCFPQNQHEVPAGLCRCFMVRTTRRGECKQMHVKEESDRANSPRDCCGDVGGVRDER